MELHKLPPEILVLIFRLLGSSYFRENVSRLAVGKWWYDLARPVLFERLELSPAPLRRLLVAAKCPSTLQFIKTHVISVSIFFKELTYMPGVAGTIGHYDLESESWKSRLSESLIEITDVLRGSAKLGSLQLEAHPPRYYPQSEPEQRGYLTARSVADLVSFASLTTIEIDASGSSLLGQDASKPQMHFCSAISAKLPRLRRLRCRVTRICPRILDVAENEQLRNLGDVVINLSLSGLPRTRTSYNYPTHCDGSAGHSFPGLKKYLESQAQKLVQCMKNPQVVRIVSHTFPGLAMHSFDAITGKTMVLESAVTPWDADGVDYEEKSVEGDDDRDLFDYDELDAAYPGTV